MYETQVIACAQKMYQSNIRPPISSKIGCNYTIKVGDGTVDHGFAYCHELYEEEVPDEIANIKSGIHKPDGSRPLFENQTGLTDA